MLSDNTIKTAKKIIKENPEYFEALVEFERTKKLPRLNYKKRANFTIDSRLLKDFKGYCRINELNMSNLIESYIKEELKKQ
ncbi:MAG: hypothetical protein AABW57_01270 [Nanoarchaeota archaeon]